MPILGRVYDCVRVGFSATLLTLISVQGQAFPHANPLFRIEADRLVKCGDIRVVLANLEI